MRAFYYAYIHGCSYLTRDTSVAKKEVIYMKKVVATAVVVLVVLALTMKGIELFPSKGLGVLSVGMGVMFFTMFFSFNSNKEAQ